eukprot:COSAG01_NODE_1208_length_11239_cov_36.000987_7_plen_356_part_00
MDPLARDYCFWFFGYKHTQAVNDSLASVRMQMPGAHIAITSDAGDSFASTRATFGAHVEMAPYEMNLWNARPPYNFTCKEYLRRLMNGMRYCTSVGAKYVVLWEEDVRLLAPLPRQQSSRSVWYHLNWHMGCCHAGAVWPMNELFVTLKQLSADRDLAKLPPVQDPCMAAITNYAKSKAIVAAEHSSQIGQLASRNWVAFMIYRFIPAQLMFMFGGWHGHENYGLQALKELHMSRCMQCMQRRKLVCGCSGYSKCLCAKSGHKCMAEHHKTMCPACPAVIHGFKGGSESFDCVDANASDVAMWDHSMLDFVTTAYGTATCALVLTVAVVNLLDLAARLLIQCSWSSISYCILVHK